MFAITYLLIMLISIAILLCLRANLNIKIIIIALLFTIMSFLIIPKLDSKVDALQYFSSLNAIRIERTQHSLFDAWKIINTAPASSGTATNNVMSFSATPVMAIVMIIMSYFPDITLLSCVCFIDYFFALKIIQIVVKNNKLSIYYFCFGFIIFSSVFAYSIAVSGIRNNMIGTIFAYIALRFSEHRYKILSWHFLSFLFISLLLILVHPYTLLLAFLFILSLIFSKHTVIMRICNVLVLFQSLFQQLFIALITPFNTIPFFSSIILKSNQYLGENATILISSNANLLRDIGRLLFLGTVFIITRRFSEHYINVTYTEFVLLFLLFAIGSFNDQLLFERCMLVFLPIVLPYIILLLVRVKTLATIEREVSFKAVVSYITLFMICIYALFCLADNLRAGTTYFTLFTLVGKY